MAGVDFFLSTISGDCILLGSTVEKFPRLPKDPQANSSNIKTHMYYLKFNQSASVYYISVLAYDESYYTVSAIVNRMDQQNKTIAPWLYLYENIPTVNYMEETDDFLRFYIEGFVGPTLFVDIE